MMMMIMMMMMMMMSLKGAIRDLLQSPHCAENCFQHVRSSDMSATVCKSRVAHRALIKMQHVVCHAVRRDSSAIKFDRVQIAFILALFYWLNQ